MTNVMIRHLSGARANQIDEFPLETDTKITFGRDPSSMVAYDAERDDLVSRNHAEIVRDADDDKRFTLKDLDSSNGTFLNGNRVQGSVDINVGDTVRFGEGGSEFQFDLDPRPDWAVKATRIGTPIPQTRIGEVPAPAADAGDVRPAVGRATVERMIDQQAAGNKRNMAGLAAGLLGVLVLVTGYFIWSSSQQEAEHAEALADAARETDSAIQAGIADAMSSTMSPRDIAAAFSETVVYIEMSWKLVHTATGQQIYHRYSGGVPMYVYENGALNPLLWLNDENGTNVPVGGGGRGSGFTVTENGFILTNRHVGAPWHTSYDRLPFPGMLVESNGEGGYTKVRDLGQEFTGRVEWVPSKTAQTLGGKGVEGRLDYLDVKFAKTKLAVPARLVRISDSADVALIKVDLPTSVNKTELYDNFSDAQPGDVVTVLGYPAISSDALVETASLDVFNRSSSLTTIPDPTVSTGNIGKVMRSTADIDDPTVRYISTTGDLYQLTVNSTGGGNSGGPVFDELGRVVAIYTAARPEMSFAVPIRHGIELMEIRAVN